MVQKTTYTRLGSRIAEEKQLLAEEKWIIDALTKIRKQRNCLQIERLELESIKTQLIIDNHRGVLSPPPPSQNNQTPSQNDKAPSQSVVQLMSTNTVAAGAPLQDLERALTNELLEEAYCNDQELNLTVTNPILSLNYNEMNMEEEESDASDDSHDDNNSIFIDMNMFMNGDAPS